MRRLIRSFFVVLVSAVPMSAQWTLQPWVTTANLQRITFADQDHGWILGRHIVKDGIIISLAYRAAILKTVDAGNAWTEVILENSNLTDIEFVDNLHGWAVGETRTKRGLIDQTTDGGSTWTVFDSTATQTFYYTIQFIDGLHGWIGGWNDTAGVVLRTTDGGVTWHTTYDAALDVNDLHFVDAVNGWAVGQNGKVYKSTDGGATWQSVYTAPDPYNANGSSPLRRTQFTDAQHGYAAGGLGGGETKLWTSDGGTTWNPVHRVPGSSLHGLYFTDNATGWTVGGANAGLTIQKTVDGGKTWTPQIIPSLGRQVSYFEDVFFVTASEGWIVADSGVVLKTTNGGETPTDVAEDPASWTVSTFSLSQGFPNPFNPSTTISFTVPSQSFVSLKVYDQLGREQATLQFGELSSGTYTRRWYAEGLPAGIYFCRMEAGSYAETRKLVLLK